MIKYSLNNIPHIKEGVFNSIQIKCGGNCFLLEYDNKQHMCYNTKTHKELYELINHINLAQGKVITTGLGFGIRESFILLKPEVTQLVVIEKNKDVIDYHKNLNNDFIHDPRLTIINADANEYVDICDVLLIDHYQDGDVLSNIDSWFKIASNVQKNIKSDVTWAWPIEYFLNKHHDEMYSLYYSFKDKINLPHLSLNELYYCVDIMMNKHTGPFFL